MDIINVSTGEIKIAEGNQTLISHAIGSCIVVSTYDKTNKIGAMAHIMLPGSAPNQHRMSERKYAKNAIDFMTTVLIKLNINPQELPFCLVGGGNVLQKENDIICKDNIESTTNILNKYNYAIVAQETGGILRRTCRLSLETGQFFYTEGDSSEKLLFDVNT